MKYEQAFNTWKNSILQAGNEVSNALTGYQLAMKVRQFLPQMQSASSLPSYVFRLMSIAWGIGLPLARRLAISMGYDLYLDQTYTEGVRFVVSGI